MRAVQFDDLFLAHNARLDAATASRFPCVSGTHRQRLLFPFPLFLTHKHMHKSTVSHSTPGRQADSQTNTEEETCRSVGRRRRRLQESGETVERIRSQRQSED